jgi:hypothetical protein
LSQCILAADNSPAIYGWEQRNPNYKVPSGTADNFLSSLTGLETFPNREPSHKWLGYFQRQANARTTKPRPARARAVRFPAGANVAQAFGHDAQAWAKYQCQSHARIFKGTRTRLLLHG